MSAITITFGDRAENNVGMQTIGELAAAGFSIADLAGAKVNFEAAGCRCDLIDLVAAGGVETLGEMLGEGRALRRAGPEPASILVVRGGVDALLGAPGGADAMFAEQRRLPADKKALIRGAVKNKIARHNLCFALAAQEPDYEAGRGRVVAFGDVPCTAAARGALGRFFGERAAGLLAEGNYYYNPAVCGIGFHGDGERRKVVALRLGTAIPLHFQWFYRGRAAGRRIAFGLDHGDLYALSEKAVGHDWRRSAVPTLRHAAGAHKFLKIDGQPPAGTPPSAAVAAADAVAAAVAAAEDAAAEDAAAEDAADALAAAEAAEIDALLAEAFADEGLHALVASLPTTP